MVQNTKDNSPQIEIIDVEGLENGLLKIDGDQNGRYFPVAVVGVGLRMPMCENMPEFESMLLDEKCAIIDIPSDRWSKHDYYFKSQNLRGNHTIPKMAFYDNFFKFDASYFNISRREVNFMDPQQRQSLMTCEQAIQDAGYTKETLPKDTGVFMGMGIIDFPGTMVENRYFYSSQTWTGFSHSCAANRVSNYFGLTGPSCAVDTACAASLTAVHCGVMALWNKECSMALAGATSHLYSPETTVAFSQLGVLSNTGNSAPFDATNNGYVRGEGTGIVVLKSLDQAIKDGDHIYCAIRATTSAHNGNSNSLTLPSAPAQQELIERCYASFGVPLGAVDFVEAHGTGTPVGDPLETKALGRTFGSARPKTDPMPVASGKSTFGHLEVCAGMVQIVKTCLMLNKRMFYKQLNWESPNPRIDFEDLNLRMQLKTEPFVKDKKFIIGVNTFGFGGSLVHMVFEEINQSNKKLPGTTFAGWSFGDKTQKGRKIAIPISAKVKKALVNSVARWAAWESPEGHDAQETVSWLATRREHYKGRRMVVLAESGADFRAKVNAWLQDKTDKDVITNVVRASEEKPKICFVFSGFTQQHWDMGRGLYKNEPLFKAAVDECDAIFKNITGYSALEKYRIFVEDKTGGNPTDIGKEACKPAILFMQVALNALFESWGIKADMVMGVGLGEVSAAYACGAITKELAIRSMVVRMAAPPKDDFLKKMKSVLNGPKPKTSRFFSTVTGKELEGALDADYWWSNVAAEKNINNAIQNIAQENKNAIFIEVSAKPVLAEIIRGVAGDSSIFTTGSADECDWETTQRVMAEVHCTGYPVNWKAITRDCARHAPIPFYGFDEEYFQLETQEYWDRRLGIKDKSFKASDGRISYDQHFHTMHYTLGEETVFSAAGHTEFMLEYIEDDHACLKNLRFPVRAEDQVVVPPFDRDGYIQEAKLSVLQEKGSISTVHDGKVYATGEKSSSKVQSIPALDINAIKNRCEGIVEPDDIYDKFANVGLTYGDTLRLLTDVHSHEGEALGLYDGPHMRNRYERIETVVLDSAFQVAIGCFSRGSSLYLPSEIGMLQMFVKKVPPTTPFVVHATLKESTIFYLTCDLTIADNDGNVWATITDFKASNTVEPKTNVDYNELVYATKYEFLSSCLPSTSHAEKWYAEGNVQIRTKLIAAISSTLNSLNSLISSFARDAIKNQEAGAVAGDCKSLYAKLERLAALGGSSVDINAAAQGLIDENPDMEPEVELIKAAAAQMAELLQNPEKASSALSSDIFINFVLSSALLNRTYERTGRLLNDAINEAFKSGFKKHVIRICEVGSANSAFSKGVIAAVADKIKQGTVEYVYTSKTSENFKAINEEFSDLSTIKYEVFDPSEEETKFSQGSFDIVIYNNFPKIPEAKSLERMRSTLTENGWFVMLRHEFPAEMYNFAAGTDDFPAVEEKDLCDMMTSYGFDDARILNPPNPMIASVVLATRNGAPTEPLTGDRWIVLSGSPVPAVDVLKKQLPGDLLSFTTSEISKALEAAEGKKTNLLYFVGKEESSVSSSLELVEELSELEETDNLSVWVFSSGAYVSQNSLSSTVSSGLFRSLQNKSSIAIQCVDIQQGPPEDVAANIIQAFTNLGGKYREGGIRKPALKIPKIVRVPIKASKEESASWRTEVSSKGFDTSLLYKTSTGVELRSNDVQVRTKAIATGQVTESSSIAFAGVVEAVGESVDKSLINRSVIGLARRNIGSHIITKESDVIEKPVNIGWAEAAESLYSYSSLYCALFEQAKLKTGDYVMIHPSSGAFCQAAVHMAKSKGAKVICSATEDRELYRQFGVVVYANPLKASYESDIKEYTEGKGIKILLQNGADALPLSIQKSLSYGAKVFTIGNDKPVVTPVSGVKFCSVNLSTIIRRNPQKIEKMIKAVQRFLAAPASSTASDSIAELETRLPSTTDSNISVFSIPDGYSPENIALSDISMKSDATYLVTGGYGRVGRELARWLAEKGARNIAVASRTGATDIFQKSVVQYIESLGATIYNITSDVSKKSDVESIFAELKKQGAPDVMGVFHLAGYTDNSSSADEDDLKELMSVQCGGADNLSQVTIEQKIDLDYFVLFGSSVSTWAHPDLPNLCAVSQHLEAVAAARKFRGFPSLCVLLGQMRGTGSLCENEDVLCAMEKAGMKSLHVYEYLDIIGTLLTKKRLPPSVFITYQDWQKTADMTYESSTRFTSLVAAASVGGETEGGSLRETLEARLKFYLGDLTGSNPEDIESCNPMTQYGVDSLMSSDIMAWAQKNCNITLLQTEIFGGLSIDQLLDKAL